MYGACSTSHSAASVGSLRDIAVGCFTHESVIFATIGRYQSFGELASDGASVGATGVYANTYTRDALGRITRKVETIQGVTTTFDYGYDDAGRLEQVDVNGVPTRVYTYDPNGNRLSVTEGATVTSGSYGAQDRLLSYGSLTFTHNEAGDLTSKTDASLSPGQQTTTYSYDALGNLFEVTLPDGRILE